MVWLIVGVGVYLLLVVIIVGILLFVRIFRVVVCVGFESVCVFMFINMGLLMFFLW